MVGSLDRGLAVLELSVLGAWKKAESDFLPLIMVTLYVHSICSHLQSRQAQNATRQSGDEIISLTVHRTVSGWAFAQMAACPRPSSAANQQSERTHKACCDTMLYPWYKSKPRRR